MRNISLHSCIPPGRTAGASPVSSEQLSGGGHGAARWSQGGRAPGPGVGSAGGPSRGGREAPRAGGEAPGGNLAAGAGQGRDAALRCCVRRHKEPAPQHGAKGKRELGPLSPSRGPVLRADFSSGDTSGQLGTA